MAEPTAADKREAQRVRDLIVRLSLPMRRAFLAFVQQAKSEKAMAQVADLLERGQVAQASAIVESMVTPVGDAMARAIMAAGAEEMQALSVAAGPIMPSVGVSFDPTNPPAAAMVRQTRLDLIRDISTTQRRAIEQAVNRSLLEGKGTAATARAFRDAIGLTATQEQAVFNYRRLLETGDASAVNRALSDGHNWSADRQANLKRRIADSRLSEAQIDRMTATYRRRYLAMRADTIARTQASTATGLAQQEAEAQLVDLGFSPNLIIRVWHTTMDGRERFTHAVLNGQEQNRGEPFESPSGALLMFPGDPTAPAAERINCRCVLTRRILRNAPPD